MTQEVSKPRKNRLRPWPAILSLLLVLLLAACNSQPTRSGASPADADKLLIVDCLLPGQIRRLGTGTTYITPRRPVKTSAADCEIRGGEYVAYDRADYRTALNVWLPKAKAGDPEAQTYVGEIYEKGLGLPADYQIAAIWYRRAADQGHSRAMTNLGYLYEKGLGVKQDLVAALNWYRKASGLTGDELQFASSVVISQADKRALKQLRAQSSRQQRENRKLKQRLAKAERRLRQTRAQARRLRAAASSEESSPEKRGAARRALREKEQRLQQQQRAIAELERRLDDEREASAERNASAALLKQQLAATEARLQAARRELRQRQAAPPIPDSTARQRLSSARQALKTTRETLQSRERELQQLRTKLALRQKKVDALNNELLGIKRTLGDNEKRLQTLVAAREKARALNQRLGEKDAKIAALRLRQQQDRRRLDSLTRELSGLNPLVDAQRSALAKATAELDATRGQLETQRQQVEDLREQLASRDAQMKQQQTRIQALEERASQYQKRLAALDRAQAGAADGGPVIEILDPPMIVTRGLPSIPLRAGVNERRIIGKVEAPAGLRLLTFNETRLTPDENGLFQQHVKVGRKRVPVKITAIDRKGQRASILFYLQPRLRAARLEDSREPRDSSTAPRTSTVRGAVDFGGYHALIIGNNDYAHYPKLKSAIRDARAVDQVLRERYGFRTHLLLNATRYDILSALAGLREKLGENDNLLIYYAGHGELDRVNKRGHWLPVDAQPDNPANWISNLAITDILNTMAAKHILVVADSCYSGAMTRTAIARPPPDISTSQKLEWLKIVSRARSRTVLTSGGLQPVLDQGSDGHSVFAKAFLDSLKHNADILEADRLYYDLFGKVRRDAAEYGISQSPEYAPIKFSGHEAGVFFFVPAA